MSFPLNEIYQNYLMYIFHSLSCGEDGTVRLFDLRLISRCHKTCCKDNILILSPSAVTAMCLSPRSNTYIAVGRYLQQTNDLFCNKNQ